MAHSTEDVSLEMAVEEQSVSRDVFYRALADERRRQILSILVEKTLPMDAQTLAKTLADRAGTDDTDRILIMCYHVHLPLLADAGLIEYSRDERSVHGVDEAVSNALP